MTTLKSRKFASVWDAVEEKADDAANLKMRAEVMIALRERVGKWRGTQAESARRLGVSQPRLNDLLRGRIDKFSLDALVNLASTAGLEIRMTVRRAA